MFNDSVQTGKVKSSWPQNQSIVHARMAIYVATGQAWK